MKADIPLLDQVRVAAPCSASWEKMSPVAEGDRVRHCGDCRLNVYNLSAMTRVEAEALLREHEGRLCVSYYRRGDGTILTSDCPVGLEVFAARPERRAFRALVAVSAALSVIALAAPAFAADQPARQGKPAHKTVKAKAQPAKRGQFVKGVAGRGGIPVKVQPTQRLYPLLGIRNEPISAAEEASLRSRLLLPKRPTPSLFLTKQGEKKEGGAIRRTLSDPGPDGQK